MVHLQVYRTNYLTGDLGSGHLLAEVAKCGSTSLQQTVPAQTLVLSLVQEKTAKYKSYCSSMCYSIEVLL